MKRTHTMTKKQAQDYTRICTLLTELGFNAAEIDQLIRIERTLHRWSEQECGGGNDYASWAIERDESGKPFRVVYPHTGKTYRTRIPDRENGALKRLASIMELHPGYVAFQQGDPRGCALYILKESEIPGPVDQFYNRGIAVCY